MRRFYFDARRAGMCSGLVRLFANCAAFCLNFDRLFNCFAITRFQRRQFLDFQDVNAEIADLAETQPGESRDCFTNAAENVFNRMKRVAAADSLKEVT